MSDKAWKPTLPPGVDASLDYIERRIEERERTFNAAKVTYRQRHALVAISLVVLAAANTTAVTLSQDTDLDKAWGYLAIALSAAIAILTGINALLRPRQRHIKNAEALNELIDVRERIRYRGLKLPPITQGELDAFFSEVRTIERQFFAGLAQLDEKDD